MQVFHFFTVISLGYFSVPIIIVITSLEIFQKDQFDSFTQKLHTMKKNFYLLVLIFLFSGFLEKSFAQIPNPSFESWTGGNPDGWITLNSPPFFVPVTQSSVVHAGSSACKSEVLSLGMYTI